MYACLHVIIILFLTTAAESTTVIHHRRTLHQPFFPTDSVPPSLPATTLPPSIPPPPPHTPSKFHYHKPKPKKTKSEKTGPKSPPPPPPAAPPNDLFFPSYSSPPSPPSANSSSSSAKSLPSFPANITTIGDLPQSSPSKPISHKLAPVAITVSLVSAALIALIGASLFYYHRHHHKHIHSKPKRSDSLRLYDTATSEKPLPPPPQPPHRPRNPSGNSAEILYLGTLPEAPRIADHNNSLSNVAESSSVLGYQKLGSPELRPLPPLPRHDYRRNSRVAFLEDYEEDNDVEFFSPKTSSNGILSPTGNNLSYRTTYQTLQSPNSDVRGGSNSKTPSDSAFPTSPSSSKSYPTDSVVDFPQPPWPPEVKSSSHLPSPGISTWDTHSSPARVYNFSRQQHELEKMPPPPWPPEVKSSSHLPSPGSSTWDTHSSPARVINFSRQQHELEKMPPPPPPMPPMDYWEAAILSTPAPSEDPINGPPPTLESTKTKPIVVENLDEIQKPKLKALHWDKVKASSNTTMVWDQMKSSTSFQLNEGMMETLFMMNSSNSTTKAFSNSQMNNENRVLDPKKSQNIAILLRALNVTIDEVCEGLLEGNIDNLGTDLLESLLKMTPTKEEESKLMEFNDASIFKLGPAEKFLKALLDVPFAFKRVDALLYIANFDSEVEYLKRSFETLEAACDELRNSKMFLKLLEAVLKTGNRMNVGTNRGDAQAFKLDTLLKLADIKGTDGRTTLLHFVVQEIIRTEGHSRLSVPNQNLTSEIEIDQQSELRDDVEFRKIGLQVVSSLSGELSNVKKAATMDSNLLYSEVGKLATGITKIGEVFRLNEEIGPTGGCKKFRDSMNGFLKKAKNSIIKIQAQESAALSTVKEITEYFHGNSIREEAHPFRIFVVVGEFLSVLDQVCRDVGKMNERTIVNSARPFQMTSSQSLPSVFPQQGQRKASI